MTPDGIAVTQRVHAAVLVCVKTAAILGAVLSLGPLKEEDYMRLVKQSLEGKDRFSWPCRMRALLAVFWKASDHLP